MDGWLSGWERAWMDGCRYDSPSEGQSGEAWTVIRTQTVVFIPPLRH